MDHHLEPQLRALADKYRERRFQLSKAETGEATTLCTKVLQDGREGFELCWQLAPYLPAESLAEAIASTWTGLDESLQREVMTRQQRLPEAAATRLRFRSAVALRPIDAAAARRLLSSACYAMTNTPKKRPSKEQMKLFRSILLNGDEPALVGFAFESHTQAETGPLLACVLEVLATRSADAQRSFSPSEPRVIEWLLQNDFFPRLTEAQRAVAVALTKSWPREVKTEFASKNERLPADLDQALRLAEAPSPPVAEKESATPSPVSKAMVEPLQNVSVRALLDQVGLAVKTIEADNKSVRDQLQEKEVALQALRTKLNQAETSLQHIEGELIESRAALDEKGDALQIALAELAELRGKLEVSTRALAIEKEKHAADSQALLDRIEVEKKRAVDSFENRLADKLRLEWRDFGSVSNRPMDMQVGESLRSLVRGIFEMLEHEGLKIRD
jgi:hypothetical protein